MEPITKPFLNAVKGKLDEDVRQNIESRWLPPLKAAFRQLKLSEEEEKGFVIDIRKYTETINPEELRLIPRDKVLPILLNAIWKLQVRAARTESKGKLQDEDEEDGAEVEESAEEGAPDEERISKPASPQLLMEQQKYKILLDKVAPFYVERSSTSDQVFDRNDVDILSRKSLSRTLWRYVIDNMEPEYPLPTLILKKHQYLKREEPRHLGPGCYDPKWCDCKKYSKLKHIRGQMHSCAPRFAKEYVKMDSPDPGAYGNPYDNLKKARPSGKVTLLQSGPCDIRGGTFKTIGASLGPGDYEVKSSIQELLSKRISTRGPYDLFSQPNRFDILHGYFRRPKSNLEPGMYGVQGAIKDVINSRCNHMKGKLSKLNRDQKNTGERITIVSPMWPTSDAEQLPGPGHYDIHDPDYRRTCWKENYWAFNTSSINVRPEPPADYDHAPTRYRPEQSDLKYCATGCGFKSNFVSKTTRLDFNKNNILNERLRPKDIPPNDKHRFVDECKWFL